MKADYPMESGANDSLVRLEYDMMVTLQEFREKQRA